MVGQEPTTGLGSLAQEPPCANGNRNHEVAANDKVHGEIPDMAGMPAEGVRAPYADKPESRRLYSKEGRLVLMTRRSADTRQL